MKNKGFTLVELLGVIAVLGILALITIPVIDKSLNSSKDKLYATQEQQIIKGAKDYYTEHLSELPATEGAVKKITINQLQLAGYLPYDIKNPKTDKNFASTTSIVVTKKGNNYKYEVDKTTIG